MARYFLELSYNGGNYNGWQVQPNAPSVQQSLQESLSKLLKNNIVITGAGRTDTGVHASYYVAHFDIDAQPLETDTDFMYHLNCVLPRDISVGSLSLVRNDAHARFGAMSREYKYFITTVKNPFVERFAYRVTSSLDENKMNHAAELLLKTGDFTSFAKLHTDNKTNICSVKVAQWSRENNMLVFTIRADRFLRNMVRSVVGTLLDVGKGKISADEFADIIDAMDRAEASSSAPSQGLYLTDIVYPETMFKRKIISNNFLL